MNNEQAREVAWSKYLACNHDISSDGLYSGPMSLCDVCKGRFSEESFDAGFDAGVEYARGGQWNLIYTGKDNPELIGWYLVSVLEMNDLGAFRYTDIMSFGHRAEIGNCWFTQSDKQTVVAWQERPKPYTEAK